MDACTHVVLCQEILHCAKACCGTAGCHERPGAGGGHAHLRARSHLSLAVNGKGVKPDDQPAARIPDVGVKLRREGGDSCTATGVCWLWVTAHRLMCVIWGHRRAHGWGTVQRHHRQTCSRLWEASNAVLREEPCKKDVNWIARMICAAAGVPWAWAASKSDIWDTEDCRIKIKVTFINDRGLR